MKDLPPIKAASTRIWQQGGMGYIFRKQLIKFQTSVIIDLLGSGK
jgi:hypothetical protein